ncbi:MAG TPA: protein kinase [Polyangiaceae bacterium]
MFDGDGPEDPPDSVRGLLKLGLAGDDEQWFGEYRLIRQLGRGGMGVVFEAESEHIQQRVALKRLIEPDLATESELRRFLFGAESQASLDHPNIVRVFHVGTHRGRPFFTMELVPGGHLGELMQERRERAPSARSHLRDDLALMQKLAGAVHHAHTFGLLHRDLKPANILLDADGEPRIADFGLAKRLDVAWAATEAGALAGTVAYMSPQQAAGDTLDRRSDVYSLGAIFYELLTRRQQFYETPLAERLVAIKSERPVQPPRELEPEIPAAVERVCLKCLEKDPNRRYSNALALRDDLVALLEGRSTSIVPPSFGERVVHRIRRDPARARRIARVVALAGALAALASYLWVAADRAERAALATNAYIANAQAGAALFQFREYADQLERTARDPEVIAAAGRSRLLLDPPLSMKRFSEQLDSVFLVTGGEPRAPETPGGRVIAQWPLPPVDIWDRTYLFRDYFRGAEQLGEKGQSGTYLARAIRSERDGELKFGVSTPLYQDGKFAGALVAIVAANSAFGRLRMKDENESGRITVLIGPRDVERGQAPEPGEPKHFVYLIHDGIRRGEEIRAPEISALRAAYREAAPPGRQFVLSTKAPHTDANYRDPVRGYEGPWYAAFAPVGATGYVMLVQSRKSPTLSPGAAVEWLRPAAPWLVGAVVCVLVAILGRGFVRRRGSAQN